MPETETKLTKLEGYYTDDGGYSNNKLLGFCGQSALDVFKFLWKDFRIADYEKTHFSANDELKVYGAIRIGEVKVISEDIFKLMELPYNHRGFYSWLVGSEENVLERLSQTRVEDLEELLKSARRKTPVTKEDLRGHINEWLERRFRLTDFWGDEVEATRGDKNLSYHGKGLLANKKYFEKLRAMSEEERRDYLLGIPHFPVKEFKELASVYLSKDSRKVSEEDLGQFFYWSRKLQKNLRDCNGQLSQLRKTG